MERPDSEEFQTRPERDPRFEQLDALASQLDFEEPSELRDLRLATLAAIAGGDATRGIEAMTAYQIAAAAWVESRPPRSDAPIGYRVVVATIWLEAGETDKGLDELWETAYQAGQIPGIESLRETLEDFVATYDAT